MVKIKVGIVTYNNPIDINNLVKSLLNSDLTEHQSSIEIINNHSNFQLSGSLLDKVDVIHNRVRPDYSYGHISKDYNSILVRGFRNLNTPDNDVVIIIQDDNIVKEDFISKLLEIHKKYQFVSSGGGDAF